MKATCEDCGDRFEEGREGTTFLGRAFEGSALRGRKPFPICAACQWDREVFEAASRARQAAKDRVDITEALIAQGKSDEEIEAFWASCDARRAARAGAKNV